MIKEVCYMEETQGLTQILTVEDVQKNLHIGRNKVYEEFARDDSPALRLGRKFGVDRIAFEQWKKSRRCLSSLKKFVQT